ncbi:MAG TPA: hypothetical protein K8V84_07415 [Nocardiopsis listeri]|uniref:hypothetical protein n=1 Tax=Nocardiopsis listeri TaxID=53440 RepID=UPI001DA959F5|nr:hypothetical protein [Nocardiopsis listeri]HJE58328.1 hypothetical protein [Nocardiopsis listeri]
MVLTDGSSLDQAAALITRATGHPVDVDRTERRLSAEVGDRAAALTRAIRALDEVFPHLTESGEQSPRTTTETARWASPEHTPRRPTSPSPPGLEVSWPEHVGPPWTV